MKKKTLHLLILKDSSDDAELAVQELEQEGFTVEWSRVETEEAFREALDRKPDLILADYVVPSFSGADASKIQQQFPVWRLACTCRQFGYTWDRKL